MAGKSLDTMKVQVLISYPLMLLGSLISLCSGTCTALNYPNRTVMFSVTILVPLFIIMLCYIRIILSVRKSRQNIKTSQVW